MGLPSLVRLNGKLMTRNSVAARVNGIVRITGVDSLDWSDEVATELVPAMNDGGMPAGIAQGPYTCAASIGVYADEAPLFLAATLVGPSVPSLDPTNLTNLTFQMGIILREDVRTRAITWINCKIKGRPSRTVGTDGKALVFKYDLQPLIILEDGQSLVSLLPSI